MALAEVLDEFLDEQRNIFTPFAHGRQNDRNHIQPIVQIFTERAVLHHLLEVGAGRRNDADVNLHRTVSTDAFEFPLLQDAQQLHLKRYRHVSDFVQEYRAAVRLLEAANARLDRTGEGAFDVAKQLRLQEVLRYRTAIDADHLLVFALAVEVNRFSNEFFSGSRFALNENGAVEACDRIDEFEDAMHRAARADNVVEPVLLVQLFSQVLILKPQLALLESLANHDRQLDELERLRQIVVCALLHRRHSSLDRAVSGDDDANGFGISNEGFFQELDSCLTRKVVIGD